MGSSVNQLLCIGPELVGMAAFDASVFPTGAWNAITQNVQDAESDPGSVTCV